MRVRRSTRLIAEPPSSATGDIAFNLIVFFLVCASVQPDSGRKQTIPRSEQQQQEQQEDKNLEVQLTRTAVTLNGNALRLDELGPRLKELFKTRPRPEDKVVVVKSQPDAPYSHWIAVTARIEQAGGIITIQTEEEREIQVP